jgi:lipopolysaccharide export system permease protein
MASVTPPALDVPIRARSRFGPLGWLPIMDRYILGQLIGPFLFGVGVFSSVALSIGVVFDLVRKVSEAGLPMAIAAEVFLLKMPFFVVLAFPMSILLATLMAYSRLSGDSELTALRSCGISAYRFVIPAIVLSVMVTGLMFVFNEAIVPAAQAQANATLKAALEGDRPQFRDENILYEQYESVRREDGGRDEVLSRLFYARKYDGEQMQGLTILDFSRGDLNQILTANSAIWNPKASTWDFFNGSIYLIASDGSYRNIVTFEQHQLNIPRTPLDLAQKRKDSTEMNIAQANESLALLRQGGNEKKALKLEVRIAQKWALPFICIVFGLVGAALGIVPNQRTSKATGFGLSVLIIFTYYVTDFIFGAMGINGTLPPYVAAFTPIVLGFLIGVGLLVRSAR